MQNPDKPTRVLFPHPYMYQKKMYSIRETRIELKSFAQHKMFLD